ncbi:MAG: hypothetical protein NTW74_01220 [Acidobacteria bacterium]|nr:hypothetical protein [Acidobacteriota bacterium]
MKNLLLFVLTLPAMAQLPISIGLKGGYVQNQQPSSEIFPLKAGPYIELNLPVLPTFETGLMFERYKLGSRTATVYQVPILVKKRINAIAIKPFFSGGITLRRIPSFNETGGGVTIAGGATIGLLPIKIEPELRYTRWIGADYAPRSNQTEFLIGIRF